MSLLSERAPSATRPAARVHLDYMDGLRALMALWVLLGHAALWTTPHGPDTPQAQPFPALYRLVLNFLEQNHYPVDVFSVLSGFCLALPVARTGKIRGGTAAFFKRRFRRILPPYYVALFLSVGLDMLAAHWSHHSTWLIPPPWIHLPIFNVSRALLISSLLLVDIFPQYGQVNGPMWSVACEFKIYFLFPTVLWVLTRYGRSLALAGAAALAYALMGLWWSSGWPHNHSSCPWYVLLFVTGVCAAESVFGHTRRPLSRNVWMSLLVLPLMAFFAVILRFDVKLHREQMPFYPILDPLLGVSTAAALALLSGRVAGVTLRPAVRLLSWRPLVFLGTFSYSIYLIYMPLQAVLHAVFEHIPVLKDHVGLMLMTLGTALILGAAYLFFLAFERPFLNAAQERNARRGQPAMPPSRPRPETRKSPRVWKRGGFSVCREGGYTKAEVRELVAEDGLGVGAEPLVEQGGVDGAVVGVEAQVAVVQVGQAGVVAVDAALDARAGYEHDAGRAVVGALRAVLLAAPPKFREGHHRDVLRLAVHFQVGDEGGHGLGQQAHQVGVLARLVGVGVEATHAQVVDPAAHPTG